MAFRRSAIAGSFVMAVVALGCAEAGDLGLLGAKRSPGPSAASASPAASAKPTAIPSGSTSASGTLRNDDGTNATPGPSPTPTPRLVPEVLAIELSTTSVVLTLQPFEESGAPVGMREHQIVGLVLYSDDRTSDRLSWRSTDTSVVKVTDGLIRAVSPLGPPPPLATASVIATALDAPTLTATCEVSVTP